MDENPGFPDWATQRTVQLTEILARLLSSRRIPFDRRLRGCLPTSHGIYAIYSKTAPTGEVLRAGRTKTAGGGLQQRIYQNHLHGDQNGNLRRQLVAEGVCADISDTKAWICANCVVQFAVVEDDRMRLWVEYMMLAVLQPRYCEVGDGTPSLGPMNLSFNYHAIVNRRGIIAW